MGRAPGRIGLYAIGLCFAVGLNQTNMDNRFAFGLWIFLDLDGHRPRRGRVLHGLPPLHPARDELDAPSINSAVVIGFICYSGAVGILMVDVGQPLRAWFTFWHPNVHSMLTEVTFCLTLYLSVLAIEYAPIVLKNRQLREVPGALVLERQLHKVMVVFAGIGTLLSFFHQGSLGGLYGVLRGNPFAFRERHRHLADDLLPLHPLGRRGRPELHPPDDLDSSGRSRASASSPRRSSRPSRRSRAGSSSSTSS